MIYKDVAEYEDNDSELAKYIISNLHEEIERLNKELDYYKREKELYRYYQQEVPRLSNIINKAIEYIENCSGIYNNALGEEKEMITSQNVLDILKGGKDNE